jgi:hypothetical protein
VEAGDVTGLAAAIDRAVLEMSPEERQVMEGRAREHAMSFDRARVFDDLFTAPVLPTQDRAPAAQH